VITVVPELEGADFCEKCDKTCSSGKFDARIGCSGGHCFLEGGKRLCKCFGLSSCDTEPFQIEMTLV